MAQDDIPALVKFWTDLKGADDIYKQPRRHLHQHHHRAAVALQHGPAAGPAQGRDRRAEDPGERQEAAHPRGQHHQRPGDHRRRECQQHRRLGLCQLRHAVRVPAADVEKRAGQGGAVGRRRRARRHPARRRLRWSGRARSWSSAPRPRPSRTSRGNTRIWSISACAPSTSCPTRFRRTTSRTST